MEFNNPALRLFNLLTQLKGAAGNTPTSSALAGVFGINPTPRELFHAIVEFQNLVNDVVNFATHRTSLPAAPLLRYVPQIESAVHFTNLDAPWANYSGRITAECLVVLEMVAHVEDVVQDQSLPEVELKELQNELNKLFEFVSVSILDKEFKTFMLQQVEHLRRCLAEYRISGPQGFVKYLETLVVQVSRHSDVLKNNDGEKPEAISKFKKILVTVKKIVGLTNDGVALLKDCQKVYSDGANILSEGAQMLMDSSPSGGALPESNMTDIA